MDIKDRYKDIKITDGEQEKTFRIFKMDCVSQQEWLIKLSCLALRSGVPRGSKQIESIGGEVAAAVQDGNLIRMPGLTAEGIKELLEDLYPFMQFIDEKGNAHEVNRRTVKTRLESFVTLTELQYQTLRYSIDFFLIGEKLAGWGVFSQS